jgi:hypothetical protein
MKKILFVLLLLACSLQSISQLTAVLTVSNPPATVSEWANSTSIMYVVENRSPVQRQVVISARLKTSAGETVATKDLTKAAVFIIEGTRIFLTKDILPLEITQFAPAYQQVLEKTGKLPAGTYQLDVQLVEPGMFGPLNPLQSRTFNLSAPQLPFLMTPLDKDTLSGRLSSSNIIFRWTPLAPQTTVIPYYRLQVFEVLPYQQNLQALRGNQPLLDKTLRGQTQYIWNPQISFFTDTTNRKFIWTIQTLDANQKPWVQTAGNGESRSEPRVFIVNRNK